MQASLCTLGYWVNTNGLYHTVQRSMSHGHNKLTKGEVTQFGCLAITWLLPLTEALGSFAHGMTLFIIFAFKIYLSPERFLPWYTKSRPTSPGVKMLFSGQLHLILSGVVTS